MKCPNCGENIPNDLKQFDESEFIDEWMDEGQLKVDYGVICPHCDEKFLWVCVWNLDSVILENIDTWECTTYKAGCE